MPTEVAKILPLQKWQCYFSYCSESYYGSHYILKYNILTVYFASFEGCCRSLQENMKYNTFEHE